MSAVVRIPNKTYQTLAGPAARRNESVGRIIEEAVARFVADEFWEAVYREDLAMRADPAARAAFDAEVASWDVALLDGLTDSPWEA